MSASWVSPPQRSPALDTDTTPERLRHILHAPERESERESERGREGGREGDYRGRLMTRSLWLLVCDSGRWLFDTEAKAKHRDAPVSMPVLCV